MSFIIAHITDPHLSPAPMPGFADLRLKRVMGFINWKRGRERLNDMAPLEAPGRGLARPASRSCRGHRGPGQYRNAGRVPSCGAMDGDIGRAGRRQLRARQSRRLCARVHAVACDDVRAVGRERRRAGEQGDLPVPPRPRRDRDHRLELRRADSSPDGDRQARQETDRGIRRALAPNRRQRPGAGRAHPSPAFDRDYAAACADSRTRPHSSASCAIFGAEAILHGHIHRQAVRSLPSRAARTVGGAVPVLSAPRPPRLRATRAIAPPIIWCGSIARASAGGSARASAGWLRGARRSANARRSGSESSSR